MWLKAIFIGYRRQPTIFQAAIFAPHSALNFHPFITQLSPCQGKGQGGSLCDLQEGTIVDSFAYTKMK
jgi:hypothetical protein